MADDPERTKLDQCAECMCNAVAKFCSLTVAVSMFIGEIVYVVGVFKLAATWGSFERVVAAHLVAMMASVFTLLGYFYLFLKGQKQIHFMSFLTGLLVVSFMLVSHSIGLAAPNVLDCGGNFSYLTDSFQHVAGGVANDLTNLTLNRTVGHSGDSVLHPRGEYDQSLLGCYDQAIILGGAIVVGFFQLAAVFDVQRVLLRRADPKQLQHHQLSLSGDQHHNDEENDDRGDGDPSTIPVPTAISSSQLSQSGLGFTRQSFAGTGVKQDAFQEAAIQARGNDRLAEVFKSAKAHVFSLPFVFIVCGLLTFISMCYFAGITMKKFSDCKVYQPHSGRCCACLHVNDTRLLDQTMPRVEAWNNVVYSALIILNAAFAFGYCVIAIRRENKYQIVCSLVAQATSVIRAGADIFLETRDFAKDELPARVAAVSFSLFFVIVSAAITPKLFCQFGWVIFKRSAGNPRQRTAYTLYQLYRSFNWLEIQSAAVLLAAIGSYLGLKDHLSWLPFSLVVLLEVVSARQIVHHLKRDNLRLGVGIALISKIFVLVYCCAIVTDYFICRSRFLRSLADSAAFWDLDPYPRLNSVQETYNGQACLGAGIVHDDRAAEAFILNLALLVIWRMSSVLNLLKIFQTTEGGGLRSLFYKGVKSSSKSGSNSKSSRSNRIKGTVSGKASNREGADTESEHSLLTHNLQHGDATSDAGSGSGSESGSNSFDYAPSQSAAASCGNRGGHLTPNALSSKEDKKMVLSLTSVGSGGNSSKTKRTPTNVDARFTCAAAVAAAAAVASAPPPSSSSNPQNGEVYSHDGGDDDGSGSDPDADLGW